MADIPVVGLCPTVFGLPQLNNLRLIQKESFSGCCDIVYKGEEWQGRVEYWSVIDKICELFREGYDSFPDVMERGYFLLLHHDVVLEDRALFSGLVMEASEKGYAIVGPMESDGVNRNSYMGKFYMHSSFLLVDPRKVGRWWEVDQWIENGWIDKGKRYILRGMDRYWKISHDVLRMGLPMLPLESQWLEPRIGKATQVLFRGEPLATHLWYSMADGRVRKDWQTIEGNDPVETAIWRREFCERYAERFGLELESCPDTVRSLDYYRRSWSEANSLTE